MTATAHQVPVIHERGVAIVQDLFDAHELSAVLGQLEARNPSRSRAGIRHALRFPEVKRLADDPKLIDIASEILGDEASAYRATLFDKSRHSNWLVVWHQDTALPLRERRDIPGWGPWSVKEGILYAHAPASALARVIALRVHFDDSGEDNGPLRVIPDTHRLGVLSDDQIEDITHRSLPLVCLVKTGGVIAMRPLAIHASSKALTSAPRRVLHIEYTTSRMVAEGLELEIA